ncbi:MAG: hypothetical protein D6830_06705 [Ignavibacteria bacterium]|nr:MAG: hypothetical protein D6830_06705 [Ignavibacteria bacterium]
MVNALRENNMKRVALLILALVISACSTAVETTYDKFIFYEKPKDWESDSIRALTIEKYSEFLSGKKFFIDPGHGGEDRKNKNSDSSLVEADLNLNVALALRDYLTKAGAEVYLSRDKDTTVDLKYRSVLANESGAEYFISIHHNAPGNEENVWTNYTSTFYHATPNDYEYEPFNHDMAKYVQRDLAYVMRNPGGLGSFDGTYSDYRIYPGDGFSVLRETHIPAILVECAFFTNRFEKFRLGDEEFNKIQAWGIFRGLGKFFSNTFPTIELEKDKCTLDDNNMTLILKLSDPDGIDEKSIRTYFDSTEVSFRFDKDSEELRLELNNISPGEHELKVICADNEGIHSKPYYSKIITE